MPVLFEWESPDVLCVKYHGVIDGNDAVDASIRMSADERFDSLKGIIIDTLGVTQNLAAPDHIDSLISMSRIMSKTNTRIRNAIVVNDEENTQALASLYTFLAEDLVWDVEMFNGLDDARVWVLAS